MIADDEQQDTSRAGGFDPRYDPAFQRGYQPRPGEAPRTRVRSAGGVAGAGAARPSRRSEWDDAEPDRGPAEAASLTIAPAPAGVYAPVPVSALDGAPGTAQPGAPVAAAAGPSLLERLELSPRRNPFMLTLWLVGAGFVVLGIVLYALSVSISYAGPTPGSDVGSLVFAQLGWMLAGPLVTTGLLTLVALLFLTALSGRRGTRAVVAEDGEDGA